MVLLTGIDERRVAGIRAFQQHHVAAEASDRAAHLGVHHSVLAAQTMQWMGYTNVTSMKTGLRGWNDYELPLYNVNHEELDPDDVEEMLAAGFCSTLMHPDRRTIMDD